MNGVINMPNWYSNYVVISGEAKALKDYFNDVKKQMKIQQSIYEKRTDEENAFKLDDENWLRNLYPKYSTKKINEDWVDGNLNSRGSIEDFSFYEKDKKIIIYANSAWFGIIEGLNDYLLNNHKGIYVEYGEEDEGDYINYFNKGYKNTDKIILNSSVCFSGGLCFIKHLLTHIITFFNCIDYQSCDTEKCYERFKEIANPYLIAILKYAVDKYGDKQAKCWSDFNTDILINNK